VNRYIEQQPSTNKLTPQRRHGFQMPFVVSGEAQHKMGGYQPVHTVVRAISLTSFHKRAH
jgi:hypothetical protein